MSEIDNETPMIEQSRYDDAQKKITEQGQELAALKAKLELLDKPPEPTPPTQTGTDPLGILGNANNDKVDEQAPLDWDKELGNFIANGEPSKDFVEAAIARGNTKSDIITFLQGRKQALDTTIAQSAAMLGGSEGVAKVRQWANANLSATELNTIGSQLMNPELAGAALTQLAMRYAQATGDNVFTAANPVHTPANPMNSTAPKIALDTPADVMRALTSTKYATDPEYRIQVQNALAEQHAQGTEAFPTRVFDRRGKI